MTSDDGKSEQLARLRRQAEASLKQRPDTEQQTVDHVLELIHELEVHQVELEMQNEELRRAQLEISALHREYEDLYEFAPCGYVTLNSRGIITRCNLTGVTLLGANKPKIIGVGLSSFVDPKYREDLWKALKQSGESGEKQSVNLKMTTLSPEGEPLWIVADIQPHRTESGEVIQWRLALVDITKSRKTEEALAESEERYRLLFENSLDGIFITTPDGKVTQANEAACKILGRTECEIVEGGRGLVVDPANPRFRPAIEERERTGQFRGELTFRRRDGTPFPVELSSEIHGGGEQRKASIIFRDISERKRTEEAQAFLLQCGLPGTGEDFFLSLARYLAETLDMGYVCIDRLEGDGLSARTLAVYHDGRFEDNVTYTLYDTPCGDVVGNVVCCYRAGVCRLFPRDAALQELAAESYVGVTLWDSLGKPIGLIALIGRSALTDPQPAVSLLKLVAPRAAGELERRQAEQALRESEETHRALVTGLPDLVMRFDRNGRHLFVSDNVEDLVGLPAVEFIGKTHRELGFPEEQCRSWEDAIGAVFERGEIDETEFEFEGKHGPVIFNRRLIPERDRPGMVRSVLSLCRDITSYRLAERDYWTLFREMLDGFALHEIICDAQGQPVDYRFLAVNPAFERLTGLNAHDIIGKTVLEVLPGTERHWIDTYGRVALTGEPAFFENYAGELDRHFEVTVFRPAPNRFACIFTDVTERKLAEELIRVRLGLLEFAASHSLDELLQKTLDEIGVLTHSPIGFYHFVENDQKTLSLQAWSTRTEKEFCKAKGKGRHYSIDQAGVWVDCIGEGRPVIHNDYAALPHRKGLPEGHSPVTRELVVPIIRAGRITAILGMGNKPYDYNEKDVEIVSYVGDVAWEISRLKRAEEEKEKLEAQLHQAQKLEAVGTLAGGIAHDFNNILSVIMGYTELVLNDTPETDVSHDDLKQVVTATLRAKDLVKQILTFSRHGEAQERRPIVVAPIIKEALKLLRSTLPTTIGFRQDIHEESGSILGDPTQFHQIVVNLCTNAAHAMKGSGGLLEVILDKVELDVFAAGEYENLKPGSFLKLTVKDTGHGMDSATLARIFDPYFTTKPVGEGSGLGLAVIQGIVKRHEGAVSVRSEPGKGTVFEILLPSVEQEDRRQVETELSSPAGGAGRILFVDDEEQLVSLGARMLTKLGYRVATRMDGFEAIKLFRSDPDGFDLVITDYTMPHMTGVDLAGEILRIRPDIPIILCTGYSEMISEQTVKEKGLRALIMKPFSPSNIARLIRDMLDDKPDS